MDGWMASTDLPDRGFRRRGERRSDHTVINTKNHPAQGPSSPPTMQGFALARQPRRGWSVVNPTDEEWVCPD
jgi:hypothetical protein